MNTLLRKGFTLIELLVVVLIIGILTAVALPQYQLVVTKSRFATLKSTAHSLLNAAEVYYLTHGTYTNSLAALDVGLKRILPFPVRRFLITITKGFTFIVVIQVSVWHTKYTQIAFVYEMCVYGTIKIIK